jgi:hypothetical protein
MAKSFKESLKKDKAGLGAVFSSTVIKEEEQAEYGRKEEQDEENGNYVRQTFLIGEADLEILKDIVYYKKITGSINYSQKQALHEAIQALNKAEGGVPQRPEKERKKEKMKQAIVKQKKQRTRDESKLKN